MESPNKWEAIYIMGQVYHSLGEAAKAIAEYTRVEDRFADAKQAIAYFMRQEISVPEVTVIRPEQAGGTGNEVPQHRDGRCEGLSDRPDEIQPAEAESGRHHRRSIWPASARLHEARCNFGDGKDYRDRTQKLALPLKDEGAYLLVCRGGDLYASGLVLVSPLGGRGAGRCGVERDARDGEERRQGRYVSNVQVKVIGSRNDGFHFRRDRSARRVRGPRRARQEHGDRPGRCRAVCVLPRAD